jgi:hypothetical protein
LHWARNRHHRLPRRLAYGVASYLVDWILPSLLFAETQNF